MGKVKKGISDLKVINTMSDDNCGHLIDCEHAEMRKVKKNEFSLIGKFANT